MPGGSANEAFQVTFPTAGMYSYICLIHPDRMQGTVEVVLASAQAPDQSAVDTQANVEIAAIMRVLNAANQQGAAPARRDAGANNTSIWYVRAGGQDTVSND